jgi:hypothetical protein
MADVLDWLTGGAAPYHTLIHCMRHDYFWVSIIVALDLGIFGGYLRIARSWSRHARKAPDSEAKRAMSDLRWIFVFCSTTYLWSLIDIVWPAWRLFAFAKLALLAYTVRYVYRSGRLEVVYRDVAEAESMRLELKLAREDRDLWKRQALEATGSEGV